MHGFDLCCSSDDVVVFTRVLWCKKNILKLGEKPDYQGESFTSEVELVLG